MYLKSHSCLVKRSCRCQSARKPSLARPAPTQNLKLLLSGPLMAEVFMAMVLLFKLGCACVFTHANTESINANKKDDDLIGYK
jgi:hypothetical protein